MNNDNWILHCVVIKSTIPLETAKQIASKFIAPTRKYYRETANGSYRFRNIAKTKFKEFRAKVINDNITLIFGKLK